MLKVSSQVHKITHPAQFPWVVASQVGEYLTWTDGKNISHPYLLKNWVVSDNLKNWTLNQERDQVGQLRRIYEQRRGIHVQPVDVYGRLPDNSQYR